MLFLIRNLVHRIIFIGRNYITINVCLETHIHNNRNKHVLCLETMLYYSLGGGADLILSLCYTSPPSGGGLKIKSLWRMQDLDTRKSIHAIS
jgi:hypothetical protein